MKGEMKRLYILILVLSLAWFMLLLSMVIPIMTSGSDFSILNPGWNGCSELGAEYYLLQVRVDIDDNSGNNLDRRIEAITIDYSQGN